MLNSFHTSTAAASIHRKTSHPSKITEREREVLTLIAYEYTAKEIASRLYLSYETVNSHRKNIIQKLGVRNTAGMVRVAVERQLLQQSSIASNNFSIILTN